MFGALKLLVTYVEFKIERRKRSNIDNRKVKWRNLTGDNMDRLFEITVKLKGI